MTMGLPAARRDAAKKLSVGGVIFLALENYCLRLPPSLPLPSLL